MVRYVLFLMQLLLLLPRFGGAQDTIVVTDTVRISDYRENLLHTGSIRWTIDSLDRKVLGGVQLDHFLMLGSSSYVRSYGGGNISLLSVRGGTAEQTLVTWNEIPVNQSGSGLCDLSLIPVWMIPEYRLENGGNGLKNGSGAVNGTVLLGQYGSYIQGHSASFRLESSSAGRLATMGQVGLGNQHWQVDVRIFRQYDANRYLYPDGDSLRRNIHGDIWQLAGGLMLRRFLGVRNQLTYTGFWTGMLRNISPLRTQERSASWQADTLVRHAFQWIHTGKKGVLKTSVAGNSDATRYVNPWVSVDAHSRFNSFHTLAFWEYHGFRKIAFGVDGAFHHLGARVLEYGSEKQLSRYATGTWLCWKPDSQTAITGGLRFEAQLDRHAPLLPGITVIRLFSNGKIYVNGARIYRMPTMNMLYWQPGGNLNLQPEHGWSITGGSEISVGESGSWAVSAGMDVYSQHVSDMMQWRPASAGYWAPVNLSRVWSRGGEMRVDILINGRKCRAGLRIWGSFTRATEITSDQQIQGKQLMYVPLFSAGTRISLHTRSILVMWTMPWTGLRYTQADHGYWLPWNMTGNLAVEWEPSKYPVAFGLRVNNIWNESWEMMLGRPMPGRTLSAYLHFNIEPKNPQI